MTRTIFKQVYYDSEARSFYYQIRSDTPLRGPFTTRESAVADARWTIDEKPRELARDEFRVLCAGCGKWHLFSETLLGVKPFTYWCKACEVK